MESPIGRRGVGRSRGSSRSLLVLVLSGMFVAASLTWSAASAHAVFHAQDCTKNNGERCYDVQGAPRYYYPWATVAFWMYYYPSAFNGVCAKAQKTDGTVKNNSACRDGVYSYQVYFDAPWIESQAFGYWYGGGGAGPVTTYAST